MGVILNKKQEKNEAPCQMPGQRGGFFEHKETKQTKNFQPEPRTHPTPSKNLCFLRSLMFQFSGPCARSQPVHG